MSKLAERMRKALRVGSQPIGFGASTQTSNPSLLLVAFLQSPSADAAKKAAERGADTCLITAPDPKDSKIGQVVEALGDIPCGLDSPQADGEAAAHLAELGVDYAALEPDTALASALLDAKLGHVISLESELDDIYLRTLEALPVEAILLRRWEGPLTVRRQMELQRISGLARKPLIVPVSPDVTSVDLQVMREAAVAAVGLDASSDSLLDSLASVRKLIDELPPRRRRREHEADAVLPRVADVVASADDEEEEGDEEWDGEQLP